MYVFARRRLLAALGSASPFLLLRHSAAAASPASLDEFLSLSARLTGRSRLDPKIARLYLSALNATPEKRGPLADLARGRSSHPELEREIILSWYTGFYKAGGQIRLATHTGALLWKALGTPAPGTCGGPMGFWAQPPAEPR